MIGLLRGSIARLVRRVAFALAAALAFLAALGFFTLAGWRALAPWQGAVVASLLMGLVYLVAGLIFVLVARGRAPARAPLGTDLDVIEKVVAAFLRGLESGRRGKEGGTEGSPAPPD